MSNTTRIALTEARLFTGESFLDSRTLLIEGGLIADILTQPPQGVPCRPCPHTILSPGLIDIQINGGDNLLLNAAPTSQTVLSIARAHQRWGTASLLPTCLSAPHETMRQALAATRAARRENSGILGLHFEGPHLTRAGIHAPTHLRPLTPQDKELYVPLPDETLLLTMDPSVVAPADIAACVRQGATVALGHTTTDPATIRAALAAGATGFTHLFNAMGPLSARVPGPAGTALDDPESWCSLIADGIHVAPEMVRLAFRAKKPGKIILVSDAMPPAASLQPQSYLMDGQTLFVRDGACRAANGTLAGAMRTLAETVRIAIQDMGISPAAALAAATANPAAFLRLSDRGRLDIGHRADLTVWSSDFTPKGVWLGGVLLPNFHEAS